MPALPLDEAGKYVAGAYVVFLGLLLIYVAIMAVRLDRMRSELSDLADLAENRARDGASDEVAGQATTTLPGQATRPHPTAADAEASAASRSGAAGGGIA